MTFTERKHVKENNIGDIKRMVFKNLIPIDDPIDLYSQHTLLHDAVIMNRVELFDFLVTQGANPMVRDQNGYTPLLKAAALGRLDMVKKLVEHLNCDPRHVDPFGVTAREKAELYMKHEVSDYLREMEIKAKRGELTIKPHDVFQRSGRYRTRFNY